MNKTTGVVSVPVQSLEDPKSTLKFIDKDYYPPESVIVEEGRVFFPDMGWIKSDSHPAEGKIIEAYLGLDCFGRYYTCITCETDGDNPEQSEVVSEDKVVGIFHGFYDYIVVDNGERIPIPDYLWEKIQRLKKLLKALSKPTNNAGFEDLLINIEKANRKLLFAMSRFQEKVAKDLVSKYDVIIVERPKPKKELVLRRTQYLAYQILEATWWEFVDFLSFECEKEGKRLVKLEFGYPSSRICSACGFVKESFNPQNKEWTCPHCQTVLNQELNAAINCKRKGILK